MDLSAATVEELNAELVRKTAGPEALDALFSLPEWVDKQDLRNAYETIVARMRRECAHVPMNTVQQLLVERVAFNYITLRHREHLPLGDPQGFGDARVLRDWNTYWLSCTQEFNGLLVKFKPSDREAIMTMVRGAVAEILATVEDKGLRNDLVERFVSTFERQGLTTA